ESGVESRHREPPADRRPSGSGARRVSRGRTAQTHRKPSGANLMIHRFEPWARAVIVGAAVCQFAAGGALSAEPPAAEKLSEEGREFFEKQVRPLLVKRCFECHGGTKAGGLSLASRRGW